MPKIKVCLERVFKVIQWVLRADPLPDRRLTGVPIRMALIIIWALLGGVGCTGRAVDHHLDEGETLGLPATKDLSTLATQTQQALSELEGEITTPSAPTVVETELTATATNIPTETTVPVDPTSTVSSTLPLRPTEIRFRTGGTLAVLKEEISAGEKHTYTLRAMEDQTMILSVSSNHQDVVLGLKGVDGGQTLLSLSDESSSTTVTLPETQDYQVTVYASWTDTVYFLSVEVPAVIDVELGEGAVSVEGYLDLLQLPSPYDTQVRYLIEVEQGRRLKVDLDMPDSDDYFLAVFGQDDGQAYLKNVKADSVNLEVPITQGYYVDVHSRTSAAFTLNVEVY